MHVMKVQRCKNALERLKIQLVNGTKTAKVEKTTTKEVITGYSFMKGVKIPNKKSVVTTTTVHHPIPLTDVDKIRIKNDIIHLSTKLGVTV